MVLEPEITVRWLEVATALATVALVIQEAMEATEDLVVIRVCLTLNLSILDFKIVSFALFDKDFYVLIFFLSQVALAVLSVMAMVGVMETTEETTPKWIGGATKMSLCSGSPCQTS